MIDKSSLDVSRITDYLFISAWPLKGHVTQISSLNIRLILSMHWIRPATALGRAPIRLLWLPTFDNPYWIMPISVLLRGVNAALPVIQSNCGVLVHCLAGMHRSVAMACCVLISQGFSADAAMDRVVEKRPVADPHIWYIEDRIYKFEKLWRARRAEGP